MVWLRRRGGLKEIGWQTFINRELLVGSSSLGSCTAIFVVTFGFDGVVMCIMMETKKIVSLLQASQSRRQGLEELALRRTSLRPIRHCGIKSLLDLPILIIHHQNLPQRERAKECHTLLCSAFNNSPR